MSDKATILHMLTPAANLSPFDVNMAVDAGWQHCLPYTSLSLEQVAGLNQDAIFSRGPAGVKSTGLFVGGRDIHLAMDMLNAARESMVPPFEISVFADPSGAFTTAAGMVACVEKHLRDGFGEELAGKRALVFGGTGPVGSTCAMLAAAAGAQTFIVSHDGLLKAEHAVEACRDRYGSDISAADGSSDAGIRELLADAELVFCAAPAGVQVLTQAHLAGAGALKVICDVNAVPPEGVEGLRVMDDGKPLSGSPSGALGIGALAVGNVKYRTQHRLLKDMLDDSPCYLHYEHALEVARGYV